MVEGSVMLTPAELRAGCRLASQASKEESASPLKRMLASHALALAQLAEKIEREEAARNLVAS
jgi:hypothetical protein